MGWSNRASAYQMHKELLNHCHSFLFLVEVVFKIVCVIKLVLHVIFHLVDLLLGCTLISFNSTFKVLDFLQIFFNCFFLYNKSSSSGFILLYLILFKFKVSFHILELFLRRQLILLCKSLLHMFQQRSNNCL